MSDDDAQPTTPDPWAAPQPGGAPDPFAAPTQVPPPAPAQPWTQPAPEQTQWNGQQAPAPGASWGPPPPPPAAWGQTPQFGAEAQPGQQVPYMQASQYGQAPQWGQAWEVPVERKFSVVGLIGLILAVIGLGLSFLGIVAWVAWLFAIPAVVLAIIGLARKRDKNLLPALALGLSVVVFVVSLVVFVDHAEDALSELFEDSGIFGGSQAGATGEDGTPGLGSVEDPIPAGTVFSYDSAWPGQDATVWDVSVDGFMPLPESAWTSAGRCIAIVGTIRPTYLPEGNDQSTWFDTPDAFAIVDDEVQYGDGGCEVSTLLAQGYGHLWDAEVPLGTTYLFYYDVFIPEGYTGDIQALVIGDPSTEGAAYIEAAELPYPGDLEADAAAASDPELDSAITDAGEITVVDAGDTFSYASWWNDGGDAWDVTVDGYIDIPTLDGDTSTECIAVRGTITPTSIADGTVSDWAATPDISAIVDGVSYWGYENCDGSEAQVFGYENLWDAEVPVGTEFRFYEIVELPAGLVDEIEAIQVGDPDFDESVTYVEAAPLAQ